MVAKRDHQLKYVYCCAHNFGFGRISVNSLIPSTAPNERNNKKKDLALKKVMNRRRKVHKPSRHREMRMRRNLNFSYQLQRNRFSAQNASRLLLMLMEKVGT